LEWQDIDWDRRLLSVNKSIAKGILGSTKSNKIRYIPLSSDAYDMLKGKSKGPGFVFVDEQGKPLRQMACCKALHRVCRRAVMRKIGWHTLRHTFASHLVQKGISIKAVQELLGHSDIKMTMRYAHLSSSELRSAIDVLDPQKNFGQPMGNGIDFPLGFPESPVADKLGYLPIQKQNIDTEVLNFGFNF
jgi:integrase